MTDVPETGNGSEAVGGAPPDEPGGRSRRALYVTVAVVVLVIAAIAGVVLLGGDDDPDVASDAETTTTTSVPDDEATEALGEDREIEVGERVVDEITEARPEARYTIQIPDSAVVTLTVSNDRESLRRILVGIGTPGEQLDSFRVAEGADEERTYILDDEAGDTYEVTVAEGPAAFELQIDVDPQDDAGSGQDAGDDVSTALELESGEPVEGRLGGEDQGDHFTLALEPGTELRFTASNARTSESRYLVRLETEGTRLFSERIAPGADTEFSVLLGPEDDGLLDLIVTEGPAEYSFTVELAEQQDGGEAGDAGEDLASAREIDDPTEIAGHVGGRDGADAYLITATAATLQVEASVEVDSERRALFRVVGPDGSSEASFRVTPGASDGATFEAEPGARYQIVVSEGPARYVVSVTEAPG